MNQKIDLVEKARTALDELADIIFELEEHSRLHQDDIFHLKNTLWKAEEKIEHFIYTYEDLI